MAVPDKRFNFDRLRPSTSIEHLRADHIDGGAASRWGHYLEFARLTSASEPLPEEQARAIATRQMQEHYSIHFHVWTLAEFRQFLEEARGQFFRQLVLRESAANGDEGIFILNRQ